MINLIISSLFYIGFVPFASGTFGSMVGLIVSFLFASTNLITYLCFLTTMCIIGYFAIKNIIKKTSELDPSYIVIDELIGQMIACMPLMWFMDDNFYMYLVAFALFRFFDIKKPLGIDVIDKISKKSPSKTIQSLCIIADDIVAGLYSFAIVLLIELYLHYPSLQKLINVL